MQILKGLEKIIGGVRKPELPLLVVKIVISDRRDFPVPINSHPLIQATMSL